ncbi:type II secretion system F family protein [Geodermatophilus sp. DSM 45219]|uniref:type II secretion system F family protein n=1 Tax=Geodermatophilus sp. DSM 45219 TaxID=1881103 RepID=UPI00088C85E9|nr:type II secretion system F family protein [Geodermatophilus sp. DSM 45219]SDN50706.1 tight adherence protein B [Geodermatophilus sp. DSM 45219]
MTGALLVLAAALLLWPGSAARRSQRRGSVSAPRDTASGLSSRVPLPVVAAVGATAVTGLLSTPLVAVLAGGCAALTARAELRRRAGVREEARLAALGEALTALGAELRSGRSLDEATRAAVGACADEGSGRALARAVRSPEDGTGGVPTDELGQALGRVAAAARLSARTGCSLAAVVGAVEDDLRARSRQRLELRSATAGSRASAALLAGLPVLGLVMGGGVGADPWRVLTTTATGQVLLVAGVGLEVAGLAWSARLVSRAVR